jgi:hypothetical protein
LAAFYPAGPMGAIRRWLNAVRHGDASGSKAEKALRNSLRNKANTEAENLVYFYNPIMATNFSTMLAIHPQSALGWSS